jgi:hypothetical protein
MSTLIRDRILASILGVFGIEADWQRRRCGMDTKKTLRARATGSAARLPIALMMLVPVALAWGYGRTAFNDPAVWSTPVPIFMGIGLIGLLTMIAGIYLMVGSALPKASR